MLPPLVPLALGTGRVSLRGLPTYLRRPYAAVIVLLLVVALSQVLAQAGAIVGTAAARASFGLAYVSFCLALYALATGAMDLSFLPRRCLLLLYAVLDLALMQGPYDAGPGAAVLLTVAMLLAVLPWERVPHWAVGVAFGVPPLTGLTSTLRTEGFEVGELRSMSEVRNNPVSYFTELVTDFGALPRALASAGVLLLLAQLVAPTGRMLSRPLGGAPRRAAIALLTSGALVVVLLLGAPLHLLGEAAATQLSSDTLTEWLVAAGAVALLLRATLHAHLGSGALAASVLVVSALALPEILTVVLTTPALFAQGGVSSFTAMAATLALVPALAVVRAANRRSRDTAQDAVVAVTIAAASMLLVFALLRADFQTSVGEPFDMFYRLNQVRLFWWLLPMLVAWYALAHVPSRGRGAVVAGLAGLTFATGVWPSGLRVVAAAVEALPGGEVLGRTANSAGASLPTLQLLLVLGSAFVLGRAEVAPLVRTRIVALNVGVLVLAYLPLLAAIGGLLPTATSIGLLVPLLWELLRKGGELNAEPQRRFKTTWFLGNVALTAPVILYTTILGTGQGGAASDRPSVTLATFETGVVPRELIGIDTTYLPSALSGQLLTVVGPVVLLIGLLVLTSKELPPVAPRSATPGRSWLVGAFTAPLAVVLLAVPLLFDRDLLPTAAGSFLDPAPDRDADGELVPGQAPPVPLADPSPGVLPALPTGAVPDCAVALSVVSTWTQTERDRLLPSGGGDGNVLAGPPSEAGRKLALRYTNPDPTGPIYATTVYEVGKGLVDVAGGTDDVGDFQLLLTFVGASPPTCEPLR